MSKHTKGPWAFWDECGPTPDNSCTPWAGANELVREAYDAEENHVGEMVLSVCENILDANKACLSCEGNGEPCSGHLRIKREDALLIAASPDLYDSLEHLEWAGESRTCLVCKMAKVKGHRSNCHVGQALDKARGKREQS